MKRYAFMEPKRDRELTTVGYVYIDGSCAPTNPGPGGFGISCATNQGDEIIGVSCFICDTATNNQMEYLAMLMAVKLLKSNKFKQHFNKAIICSDSQILITTLHNKTYNPSGKNQVLALLRERILEAIAEAPVPIELKWIPREANERADELSKMGSSGLTSVKGMKIETDKLENQAFQYYLDAVKAARQDDEGDDWLS